ncbi:MAG: fibronectin type III domain-containing protein [Acidobacteriota bacterium]|nr:fibronectin type III domain-containing protein [Acidobacteriota bacterium]MDE3266066.1 fibronectin type III domain-containing protein [Acidobacteriota bacterium]
MNDRRFPARDDRRRGRLIPSCLPLFFLVFLAASAQGQRLLNIVPLGDDPTSGGWSVEVDHDLLRSAPQRLEVEVPDGRVLTPEMSVFEDRGDGNAMWAGGYAELGYDSVVLTLRDGHLLGRIGLPEGGAYWLRPGSDGGGLLTEGREPSAQACGGGVVPGRDPLVPAVAAQRADPPETVASASNHDRLDILMLYTPDAATRLRQAGWGEPGEAMQLAIDYLNLVFRNNQFTVTAHMAHHEEAPAALAQVVSPLGALAGSRDVLDLRSEHDADLVHLFFAETPGFCGQAYVMFRGVNARNFWPNGYGVTTVGGGCVDIANQVREGEYANQFETFAHEIGHNLGGNHDPDNTEIEPSDAVEPYAYGHHNFEPQPNVKSVMSYNEGRQEPFFSNVRVRPRGFTMGVAGERENERAIQRTIHIAAQLSDNLPGTGEPPPPPPPPPTAVPARPTDLKVMPTGSTSVKVSWTDQSNNEDGFQVHARLQGSGWATVATVPANTESADIDGLESGGRYDFRVRAYNRDGGRNSNVVRLVLQAVDYTDCVPSASQITFAHGYTVSMCVEYQKDGETVVEDAKDYGLESRESGLLYFFDRDNAEVLVKVLDACAVNGFRWVFVAPVTDLAFNLYVDETSTNERWEHRNPRGGQTASTKSDVAAFPCQPAGSTVAAGDSGGGATGVELVDSGLPRTAPAVSVPVPAVSAPLVPVGVGQAIAGGEGTDCEPSPVATLAGGYTVNMCVEYLKDGVAEVREARDFGLESQQSGLLYFFERSNAEVLIKVLDACGVNGHRWVFVAPVTDLAFNLTVVSPNPDEEPWTHSNRLSQTASPKSDTSAFACSN